MIGNPAGITCKNCTLLQPWAAVCKGCGARMYASGRTKKKPPVPPPSERFVVRTVSGDEIRVEGGLGGRSYATLYYVLDSAVCYRIVREFRTRKDRAEKFAARLNRADAETRAAA